MSRQSSGRRDFIINRIHGKKEYTQKRHLVCSLKKTHALFQNEYPDIKVGLSKFSSLRLMHFLLLLIYQEISFYIKWHVLIKPSSGRYLKRGRLKSLLKNLSHHICLLKKSHSLYPSQIRPLVPHGCSSAEETSYST